MNRQVTKVAIFEAAGLQSVFYQISKIKLYKVFRQALVLNWSTKLNQAGKADLLRCLLWGRFATLVVTSILEDSSISHLNHRSASRVDSFKAEATAAVVVAMPFMIFLSSYDSSCHSRQPALPNCVTLLLTSWPRIGGTQKMYSEWDFWLDQIAFNTCQIITPTAAYYEVALSVAFQSKNSMQMRWGCFCTRGCIRWNQRWNNDGMERKYTSAYTTLFTT